MIQITKAEKELLVKAFPPNRPPYYRFPRTMKQDSKRGHYYCVESPELMNALHEIRHRNVVEGSGKEQANNRRKRGSAN